MCCMLVTNHSVQQFSAPLSAAPEEFSKEKLCEGECKGIQKTITNDLGDTVDNANWVECYDGCVNADW